MARRATSAALLCLLLFAACRTAAPTLSGRVPDPLAPPVPGPALDDGQRRAVHAAVAAAERGDVAAAERNVAGLPAAHPVARLVRLEVAFLGGRDVATDAIALAREIGTYGAAWELAVNAATAAGRTEDALDAGRDWARVAPSAAASGAVARLADAVVRREVTEIGTLLDANRAAEALARARRVQELVPESTAVRELAVRAALAAGVPREAAALVPSLPDDPPGLLLKARVAEALGQWELAASLFEKLPKNDPGRCEGLARARQQWRLLNSPPYLQRAVESRSLRRRELAAILIWEHPELAERQRLPVPVFEDVVQLPEQGDILTVARDGVMRGDAVTRRFSPDRGVGPAELRVTLERLAQTLGAPAPRWCDTAEGEGCLPIPAEPDGGSAADLVRRVAREGGDECR